MSDQKFDGHEIIGATVTLSGGEGIATALHTEGITLRFGDRLWLAAEAVVVGCTLKPAIKDDPEGDLIATYKLALTKRAAASLEPGPIRDEVMAQVARNDEFAGRPQLPIQDVYDEAEADRTDWTFNPETGELAPANRFPGTDDPDLTDSDFEYNPADSAHQSLAGETDEGEA